MRGITRKSVVNDPTRPHRAVVMPAQQVSGRLRSRRAANRVRIITHALLALSLLLLAAVPSAVSFATAVGQPEARLDVIAVFDTSGRLYGASMDSARRAAATYVRTLPASARIGVVNYGQFPTVIRDLSRDKDGAIASISAMKIEGDTPPMYDGISLAADQFDLLTPTKRQILLVSDGFDQGSATLPTALEPILRQRNIRIDVVKLDTLEANIPALEALSTASSGSAIRSVDFVALRALAARTVQWATPPPPTKAVTPTATDKVFSSKIALFGGLAAVFAALLVVGLSVSAPKARKVRLSSKPEPSKKSATPVAGFAQKLSTAADHVLEKQGKSHGLNAALERAGLNIRPGEFMVVAGAATMMAAAVGYVAIGGIIGAAGLGAFVAVFGMRFFVVRKGKKRSAAFGDQLSDTLQLLASSLRAGQGLMQAIDSVAKEGEAPASDEFRRVIVEARLGRDLIDSLKAMSDRVRCEDFNWVIPAIEINREVGGDLAEVLDTVSSTIRDRADIRRQVKTLSAEGRLSAYVLLGLPVAIAFMVRGSNPEYIGELEHGVGLYVAGGGIALMVIGGFWLFSLCKIEF